jgi:hypothetical protein
MLAGILTALALIGLLAANYWAAGSDEQYKPKYR